MTLWRCSDASEGKAKGVSTNAAKALRMAAVGANSTAIKNHTWCTVTADGDVINANTGKVVAKAPLPPKPEALAESGSGGGNDTPSAEESNTGLEKTAGDGYNNGYKGSTYTGARNKNADFMNDKGKNTLIKHR